jgi:hypothetical protein
MRVQWPICRVTNLVGVVVLMVVSSLTLAGPRGGHGFARDNAGADYSLDRAAREVGRRTGGRVLSAETRKRKGSREHRIKVLTPRGHVRQIRVDPRTGKVMD